MNEFEEEIKLLKEIILNGGKTKKDDWKVVMNQLCGSKDVETINNIYEFVKKYFPFEIEKSAEGYVYFGGVDADGTTRA